MDPLGRGLGNEEAHRVALVNVNPGGGLQKVFHAELISLLIALGAGGSDAGAFPGIEKAPLDGGGVCVEAHDAPQGVNFADHMPLPEAPNRGVTAHLADRIEVLGQNRNLAAQTSSGERGFQASVACADDQNIVFFGITEHGVL